MRIRDWSSDVCSSDLVGGAVDLKLQTAGVNGIARHVITPPAGPETAPQKGIARAIDKAAPAAPGDDHRTIEAAAVKAAIPGVAEAGARYDALAALVDAIVHADDQIGAFAVRRGAIAIARQFARDDIRILAKLDAALRSEEHTSELQ